MLSGGQPRASTGGGITQSNLLSLTGTLVVGLLFFFALSSEIQERNLILIFMFIPFVIFSILLRRLLSPNSSLDWSKRYFLVGVLALLLSVTSVGLDNVFGGMFSTRLSNVLFD